VSAGTLIRNYGATNSAPTQIDQPLLSSKKRSHFQTHKRSCKEHLLDHGSGRGPKPRMTALARTSSNLLDWSGLNCGREPNHVPSECVTSHHANGSDASVQICDAYVIGNCYRRGGGDCGPETKQTQTEIENK
jgi:hypothetical protein